VTRPRRPFKFWAITATAVVMVLFGAVALIVGPDAETRLLGVSCVLFFGPGMAAYLGPPLLTRHGPLTVEREYVQTSVGQEAAFVFPIPAAKRNAQLLAAVGLTGGTAAFAVAAGGGVVLIAIAVMFGLVLLIGAAGRGRAHRLVLTPTRVASEAIGNTTEIPWEAVDRVQLFEMPAGQATLDMLGVMATDRDAVVWTRGKLLGRMNRRLSRYDLITSADTFAGEGEDVVHAIRRYRDDPQRRRRIGDDGELTALRQAIGEDGLPA
jgi:hypothetical protein